MEIIGDITINSIEGKSHLYLCSGSILEFEVDALVNAANTKGIGGGGIDGMINDLRGEEFVDLRIKLPPINEKGERIEIGNVVSTCARGKINAKYVIHAVGPDYRDDELLFKSKDIELYNVYKNIVRIVNEELTDVKTIGCCLLSAGIFSGNRNLNDVINIACESLINALKKSRPINIYLMGYTEKEKKILKKIN